MCDLMGWTSDGTSNIQTAARHLEKAVGIWMSVIHFSEKFSLQNIWKLLSAGISCGEALVPGLNPDET